MADIQSSISTACPQCGQDIPAQVESSTPARTLDGAPRTLLILDMTDLHAHLLTRLAAAEVRDGADQ